MANNSPRVPKEDDLDTPVWGAANFAPWVGAKNTRQVWHLLKTGAIDADKVGDSWVSTPRRLRRRFTG
jgi:hypothetical protein